MNRGQPWTGAGSLSEDRHGRDIPFLDSYAKERWEVSKHYNIIPFFYKQDLYMFHAE